VSLPIAAQCKYRDIQVTTNASNLFVLFEQLLTNGHVGISWSHASKSSTETKLENQPKIAFFRRKCVYSSNCCTWKKKWPWLRSVLYYVITCCP
jgi:hypothetical protein